MAPKTTKTPIQAHYHEDNNQKNTCIQVLHLNVRSLKKHFGELESLIHGLQKMSDLLCLSETWLNRGDDANSLLVTGYHQYALTNRNSKKGGVMIQLKSGYDSIRIHKNPLNEAAVIENSANSLRFFVAFIYNKPSMPKMDFLKIFDNFLESWTSNTKILLSAVTSISIFLSRIIM